MKKGIVLLLLTLGMLVGCGKDENNEPFIFAVRENQYSQVEQLIKKGVDVNQETPEGYPLQIAIENKAYQVALLLAENNATTETTDGSNLLHTVILSKDSTIQMQSELDLIVELAKKEDINKLDEKGCNAILYAALKGEKEVVALLAENGADIQSVTAEGENLVMQAVRSRNKEMISYAIEKVENPWAVDKQGNNPMMMALLLNKPEMALDLLKVGAPFKEANKVGNTPLILASEFGHEAVVQYLVEKGADQLATNHAGETALQKAEKWNHDDIVKILKG